MKYKTLLVLSLASLLGTTTAAAQPSYNYLGLEYTQGELLGEDFTGYGVEASIGLGQSLFLKGTASTSENDEDYFFQQWTGKPELMNYSAGLGVHAPLSEQADVVVGAKYIRSELDIGGSTVEADGFGIDAGIRAMLTDNVELEGMVNYIDGDDFEQEIGYRADARFYLTSAFSLSIGYFDGDEGDAAEGVIAGLRLNF